LLLPLRHKELVIQLLLMLQYRLDGILHMAQLNSSADRRHIRFIQRPLCRRLLLLHHCLLLVLLHLWQLL
jgi:hypothetical protein